MGVVFGKPLEHGKIIRLVMNSTAVDGGSGGGCTCTLFSNSKKRARLQQNIDEMLETGRCCGQMGHFARGEIGEKGQNIKGTGMQQLLPGTYY